MSRSRLAEFRRFCELTLTIAVTEFKLRYYGNALGYFWTLAKPLAIFGVLYVAFTEILSFGDGIEHYPAMLVAGIVLYTFFADATGNSVGSLVASGSLIRKTPVPALAIPVANVLQAFFTLCLNMIVVMFFFWLDGVEVTRDWLQFPLILAGLFLFTVAMSSLLASIYVPFRDTGQIWEVGLQLFFWGSPIVYAIETIPNEELRHAIGFNPLAVIIMQVRHTMIDPSAPSAVGVAGTGRLIVSGLIVVAILACGALLYRYVRPRLAEQI